MQVAPAEGLAGAALSQPLALAAVTTYSISSALHPPADITYSFYNPAVTLQGALPCWLPNHLLVHLSDNSPQQTEADPDDKETHSPLG